MGGKIHAFPSLCSLSIRIYETHKILESVVDKFALSVVVYSVIILKN